MRTVALTAAGRPVGMLAMRGRPASEADRALLRTFANHAALALERAQLREQALRSELLGGGRPAAARPDRGGVARPAHPAGHHEGGVVDPLATRPSPLSDADTHELHGLIDMETDRLTRLVTSLLRHDPLRGRRARGPARARSRSATLVTEAVVAPSARRSGERPVDDGVPADLLPDVDVDQLLDRPGTG